MDCTFSYCSAESYGAVYFSRYLNGGYGESGIWDNNFEYCKATKYGGAVGLFQEAYGISTIDFFRNTFSFNSAGEVGGAIFFNKIEVDIRVDMYDLTFFNNSVGNNQRGMDVAFHSSWRYYSNGTNLKFKNSYSTNTDAKSRVVLCKDSYSETCEEYDSLTNALQTVIDSDERYIDGINGNNNPDCGKDEDGIPCKSITYVFSVGEKVLDLNVKVFDGGSSEGAIDVNFCHLYITSVSEEKPVVKGNVEEDNVIFSITTGLLDISNIIILKDTDKSSSKSILSITNSLGRVSINICIITSKDNTITEEISTSDSFHLFNSESSERILYAALLDVSTGLVSLTNVEFKDLIFYNSATVNIPCKGDYKFYNCTFNNIKKNNGDGVALAKDVNDGELLQFENCSFIECMSPGEYGNAIRIIVNDHSKLEIGNSSTETIFTNCYSTKNNGAFGRGRGIYLKLNSDERNFVLENLIFKDCNAEHGKNLYLEAVDLENVENNDTLKYDLTYDKDKLNDYAGSNTEHYFTVIYLVLLLHKVDKMAYVVNNDDGNDIEYCGDKIFPCRSINYVGRIYFSDKTVNVGLLKGYKFNEELLLDNKPFSISGADSDESLLVACPENGNRRSIIYLTQDVTFTSITFSVPLSLNFRTCFIEINSNTTTLTNCCVELKDIINRNINYSIVKVSGGYAKLIIDGFTFREETVVSYISESMINIIYGTGEIKGAVIMNVFGVNDNGIIKVENQNNLSIEDSSFASSLENRPGHILNLNINGNIIMRRVTVDGGEDTNTYEGNGGGLSSRLVSGSSLKIENSTYSNCVTTGCGGGIYLELNGGSFSADNISNSQSSLEGLQMNKCSAKGSEEGKGRGGGLYICDGMNYGSFCFGDISFTDCSADHSGSNIYVRWNILKNVININIIKITLNSSKEQFNEAIGYDENGEVDNIPLALFLKNFADAAYVNSLEEEGFDYDVCGFEIWPCKTINKAVEYRFSDLAGEANIQLVNNCIFTRRIDFGL